MYERAVSDVVFVVVRCRLPLMTGLLSMPWVSLYTPPQGLKQELHSGSSPSLGDRTEGSVGETRSAAKTGTAGSI